MMCVMRVRALRVIVALTAGLGLRAATVEAQPVLHERVFGLGSSGMRCRAGICVSLDSKGSDGKNEVRAVEQDGRLIASPTGGATPQTGEQIFHPEPEHAPDPAPGGPPLPGDPPPERRPVVRMDRDTGKDAEIAHTYHTVFTPSEFPYKRMSVLDWVTEDEALSVFDAAHQRVVAIGVEARRAEYDAFWGSIIVDLEPGKWVALPSVSAESRLLHYRTEPPSRAEALEFARDSADNFFVRATSEAGGAGGQRRLIWLTDVPQSYFGGPIPPARLDDEPRTLLRPLPAKVRKVALGVLDALHIRPVGSAPLRSVLDPLVEYFRSFEAGDTRTSSSSTYRDLALSKHGVCRHRAYAFVITALAAGIPSRYVENELHVFVEVYLPRLGWRRINLGGAALDDSLAAGDERPMHRVRGEDPLPKPPQFTVGTATPPMPRPSVDVSSSQGGGGGGGVGAKGTGSGGRGETTQGSRVDLSTVLDSDANVAAREPQKQGTRIEIAVAAKVAYRGDTLEVVGRVTETSGALGADLPVEVYLEGALGAERIADTRSGPDGSFSIVAALPAGLAIGSYGVVVRTPGDARRRASSSRSP